jgi:hypothetical protein
MLSWTFGLALKGLQNSTLGFNPISANLFKASMGRMYFVPEGQYDRSQAQSAWESVPRKYRPVGYGMIGRSQSQEVFLVGNGRHVESVRIPARIIPCPTGRLFGLALPGTSCLATIASSRWDGPIFLMPPGTSCLATIACPSGTKAIRHRRASH